MKPVSPFLLAACLLAVQAENLTVRTFDFVQSHPAQLPRHHGYIISAQAQGHSSHALPAHHGSHAGHVHQAHGHVVHQRQGQFSNAHQHQVGPGLQPNNHVGSNIANSISHVFDRVVNPVVALLQNASVWLNRTAHQDPSATSLQHSSSLPHTAVIKKKLAVIKKLNHQPMSTASVPARRISKDCRTTRSRLTTKRSTLAPVVVSTLGAPAPTLGVPAPRADTFTIATSTIASTDMPAFFPEEVSSKSNVAVPVTDTTATVPEPAVTSPLTSTHATLYTRAATAHTTSSSLGPLNLRANSFTISSTDLPASIHQEVSSTTRLAVDTTTLVSQSTLPSAATIAETTARATLSTMDFTSTVATTAPTLGSLDPRADPFTALATSTDESTFGPVHREQASTATVTSPGTKAPTPLIVESNARTLPISVPKQLGASTSPATVGAVSVRPARFTAAPTSVEITSALPFAAAPTILGTEAAPTATTSEGITIASTTDSAVTLPVVALSATLEPASSQPGKSTVYARSVHPKTR